MVTTLGAEELPSYEEARQRVAMSLAIEYPSQNYIVVLKRDALALLAFGSATPKGARDA